MNSENKEQSSQKPKNNFIRNGLIMLVVIVSLVLLFWAFSSKPKGENITVDQFYSDVAAGRIERVELNVKQISVKAKDGKWYWFYNRASVENSVLEYIEEYNKTVENSDPSLKLTKVKIYSGTTTTFNVLNLLYPILLLVVLGFLVFMVMRQLKGINKSSMDFTKNRARVSSSKVKFEKVAGADEEKAELEEIIQFLKDPEKFTKVGARIPKGVLLVGPPGTGKTLLAKAVAGEADVPFFTISGSDFMELYVGVGASRVRDLFENAKKAKPCIVFIDEIDAVGRQRGTGMGGGNDEREQTLNQLLVQMDGFEENEGIIVMAATNRADILDPALTRPGRFDRQIYISAPDVKGREEILRVHSNGKPLGEDVKLKEIARVTSGFTGADLENLLNESAILAARDNRQTIIMEDINNAMVKVTMGPQRRSRVVTDEDKKITAYHEAGHAIVEKCVEHANPVHEVSIVQRGGAAGYTISRPENDEMHMSKNKLIDVITMMLGGRSAEELFIKDVTTGASNDISRATSIARKMVTEWGMSAQVGLVSLSEQGELFLGRDYQTRANYSEKEAAIIDQEVRDIINVCHEKAKEILTKNKDKIETMVKVLLEKETIYSDEVDMIMNGKSAEEIIEAIDKKYKDKEDNKKKEAEKLAEQEKARELAKSSADLNLSYVDALLKEAEARSKKLNELAKKAEATLENKEASAKENQNKEASSKEKPVKPKSEKADTSEKTGSASGVAPKKTTAKKSEGKATSVSVADGQANAKTTSSAKSKKQDKKD